MIFCEHELTKNCRFSDEDPIQNTGGNDKLPNMKSSTTDQIQHVPFQKLNKAARKGLSTDERALYDLAAAAALKKEKQERKRARKAAKSALSALSRSHDAKSLNQSNTTSDSEGLRGDIKNTAMDTSQAEITQAESNQPRSFLKLTSKQIDMLNTEELDEYNRIVNAQRAQLKLENRAKKVKSRLEKLQLASDEVSAAIANSSSQYQSISKNFKDMVGFGKTFYARHMSPVPEYGNKSGSWKLHEMFSADANPLQIHEISFNRFAPYFLSWYSGDWGTMNQKMITGAFSIYVSSYYGHLSGSGPALDICRATASASDAITFTDAKVLANQLLRNSGPAQTLQIAIPSSQRSQLPSAPVSASRPYHSERVDNDEDMVMDDVPDTVTSNAGNEITFTNGPAVDEEPIDIDLRQAELYLQQRYYPSSDLNILRCLACSKTGHHTLKCPLMTCTICQTSGVHSEAMCPQKKRCNKCRERGHQTEACKEKLSLPKSEMSCDICHSTDHLEMACHYVWRSFDPRPEEIFTVQHIPVECYTCGYSSHFGPECGLHRGVVLSGGFTWSKNNLNTYVDPSSNSRALSAGKDFSIPNKGPNRGHANDPITIDDESDAEPFIRPKVLPSRPKGGKIQVQPVQQNQKAPQKRQKKNKNKQPAPAPAPPPKYQRNPNAPRASRPDFSSEFRFDIPPQNPPSGPRGGVPNNFGHANRGGGGGALPSRADRRRMADQAGARGARPGGF